MATFEFSFTVDASLAEVSRFHHDTSVLKRLTPPPIFAQIHEFEPLGENSLASFTLWFGPIPIHWQAVHTDVDEHGFTDTQLRGPLKRWRHTHHFTAIDERTTRVDESIDYEHHAGWKGLLSRLLFSGAALKGLFTARMLITRRLVKRDRAAQAGLGGDV